VIITAFTSLKLSGVTIPSAKEKVPGQIKLKAVLLKNKAGVYIFSYFHFIDTILCNLTYWLNKKFPCAIKKAFSLIERDDILYFGIKN
jgi:hypothetical protein